jgi:hypothetical protein
VELMPYHALGASKYGRIRRRYALPQVTAPGADDLQGIRQALEKQGHLRVRVTPGV